LSKYALDLINRKRAEIDYWKRNVYDGCMERERIEKEAKAEAIKEFSERLKEKAHTTPVFDSYCGKTYMGNVLKVYVADIDNLVKEKVG
jgi:hypothetical protein